MSRCTLRSMAALAPWSLAVVTPAEAGSLTYISLGDSVAFGETDSTYSLTPPAASNIHPNALGDSVIADPMIQAAVPEPGGAVLLGIGVLGIFGLRRCSRSARF